MLDDLDAVLSRFQSHTYNKALLFVDNAGADVLLGMVPFARELLKRGTKVRWSCCVLCAVLWCAPLCVVCIKVSCTATTAVICFSVFVVYYRTWAQR